ncbi:glycoside hydrolase [Polyplosphaeria fusca]|uniref:Glycoside hydrolase n=1 Tax=Polyplosphaeria fusca TaxID=682080 RepID=A0A9P4QVC6_9PLEO|nr:glycoside hydrolase [Polyplosphaeria fusca]
MATLLESKVYDDANLFYSTNLQKVDYSQFQVPWFYRSEFALSGTNSSHLLLKTHGITSRADIYVNGKLVADKNTQAGAYGGLTYDITSKVAEGNNVLLVRVYPTDYNRDLALGFVDWNPYPPDNGTGIWRDVEVAQTGPLRIEGPRVVTTLEGYVSVRVDVQNLEEQEVKGEVACTVHDPDGTTLATPRKEVVISGKATKKVSLEMTVKTPKIWWPAQWGSQPLYTVSCTASTPHGLSDTTPPTRFGIRTVTSHLSASNDTSFTINNHAFLVLGAGYTSDIFLRFSPTTLRAQLQYVLSMGLNTIRLEGKQEHPELYTLASELGVMVLAGWECCDKWEAWSFNDEGSGLLFTDPDYAIANISMRHEAALMQPHPAMLGFLVGSDFWPDDRATGIYVAALKARDWDTPIIASASQRGFPKLLGNGGMKMDGPYDWVPPSYWSSSQLGGAFGFGSELGAGVGTPTMSSLARFLSEGDREDLWRKPEKGLYHMSTNVSSFYTREIYNKALWARYGAPAGLQDYVLKAQMADYEAVRAQVEGFAARQSIGERPATGMVYWMLNNAWPALHWSLFDYYLHPAGAYFGARVGGRKEHVAYDVEEGEVYVINRSLGGKGKRSLDVEVEVLGLEGVVIAKEMLKADTEPNKSGKVGKVQGVDKIKGTALLRLVLKDGGDVLSRNVYWLSSKKDVLDWDNSTWYYTPVTKYADFTGFGAMAEANVVVTAEKGGKLRLENKSTVPAVFIQLNLVDTAGKDIVPVFWSDNYVTLWPGETQELDVQYEGAHSGVKIEVLGRNVKAQTVSLGGY